MPMITEPAMRTNFEGIAACGHVGVAKLAEDILHFVKERRIPFRWTILRLQRFA